MAHIILQPTANSDAREHYLGTIEKPVNVKTIFNCVDSSTQDKIRSLCSSDMVSVWGVTNGKKNVNYNKWCKIKSGDFIMFAAQKEIFSTGVTICKFKSPKLARKLWGENQGGETWENIYLIEELKHASLSYKTFNELMNYEHTNIIQGFNVIDEARSERLLNKLQLYSDYINAEMQDSEYDNEVERLMNSDLDTITNGTSRREQSYLRKRIFKDKKQWKCSLCGEEFPVDLMVTAHIKKRADCTKEERLDIENIVLPMCKLGCDDLYEKGYILVKKGVIEVNKNKVLTARLEAYLDKIKGKKCVGWKEDMEKYFDYHNTNASK